MYVLVNVFLTILPNFERYTERVLQFPLMRCLDQNLSLEVEESKLTLQPKTPASCHSRASSYNEELISPRSPERNTRRREPPRASPQKPYSPGLLHHGMLFKKGALRKTFKLRYFRLMPPRGEGEKEVKLFDFVEQS